MKLIKQNKEKLLKNRSKETILYNLQKFQKSLLCEHSFKLTLKQKVIKSKINFSKKVILHYQTRQKQQIHFCYRYYRH